jgi:nucleotide-binding universal stress UspA family protein
MKTILVPVDFSDATPPVIQAATALAAALRARLVLLHVTAPPMLAADDLGAAQMIADLTKRMELTAARRLAHWRSKLQAGGATVEVRHATTAPVAGILDAARKLSPAYLVIGSHGHGAFYDLLVGSIASAVLKRAPCPVVVVPIRRPKNFRSAKKT